MEKTSTTKQLKRKHLGYIRRRFFSRKGNAGFTLIELLVVLFCIIVLALIIFRNIYNAVEKARIARAYAELAGFKKAIDTMALDTKKWPNGCTIGHALNGNPAIENSSDNEVILANAQSGLRVAPTIQSISSTGCGWTTTSIAAWKGPYFTASTTDPWGHPYWFDNDYFIKWGCPGDPLWHSSPSTAVVVSLGPDGNYSYPSNTNAQSQNCDDIYIELPSDHGTPL
jgi:type II secretory pathway pseudopilin PulG